jgi:cytochrome c oxidase subunit II
VTALYAGIFTLIASVTIVALALFISDRRLPVQDAAATTATIYRTRAFYFTLIVSTALITLAVTLPMIPYPVSFAGQKPDVVVNAQGQMWFWTLTPVSGARANNDKLVLPVSKLVEFDVTSKDVNHNFAIYNSAGHLIAQVQAMPGYTNRLLYRFSKPGSYYAVCLEYCGLAHHAMNSEFDVR